MKILVFGGTRFRGRDRYTVGLYVRLQSSNQAFIMQRSALINLHI